MVIRFIHHLSFVSDRVANDEGEDSDASSFTITSPLSIPNSHVRTLGTDHVLPKKHEQLIPKHD